MCSTKYVEGDIRTATKEQYDRAFFRTLIMIGVLITSLIVLSRWTFAISTTDFNRFYRLNEATGPIIDYGSASKNMTIIAGSWLGQPGVIGNAINVSGENWPVATATGGYFDMTKSNSYDIAFWIYGNKIQTDESSNTFQFATTGLTWFGQINKNNGFFEFGYYDTGGSHPRRSWISDIPVLNNSWNFIRINSSGGDTVDMYINTKLIATTCTPYCTGGIASSSSVPGGDFYIGSYNTQTSYKIDIVAARFNGQFNSSELEILFNSTHGTELQVPYQPPVVPEGVPVNQTPTPTGFGCTVVNTTAITCSWTAQGDTYMVFRDGSNVDNTTSTSYTSSGLTSATSYQHYIKAYNMTFNLSQSNATSTVTNTTAGNFGENSSIIDSIIWSNGWRQVLNNPYNNWIFRNSGNISNTSHATLAAPNGAYVPIALVGNMDSNTSDKELMVGGDGTTLKIYKLPYLTLNKTVTTGTNIKNYALYDVDQDGIEEIFNVKAAQAELWKYNASNDNFYLWKNKTIASATSFDYQMPVCRNGYCYWNDQKNQVFKYDVLENRVYNFSMGTAGSDPDVVYKYIRNPVISDNCTNQDNTTQIVFFSDYDGDNYLNDILIVPLNSFQASSAQLYSLPAEYTTSIVNAIVCAKVNGIKYLGFTTNGEASNELWDDGVFKINSSNMIEAVDYQGGPEYADHMNVPVFIDVNGDGQQDYCIAYDFYGIINNPGNYTTKFWCRNFLTKTDIFHVNFNPAGHGAATLQKDRTQVYGTILYGDYLGTGENVFVYGNHILNASTGVLIKDWGVQKLDTRNLIPISYGSGCTNIYYTSKTTYLAGPADPSVTVYGDYSTQNTCSYNSDVTAPASVTNLSSPSQTNQSMFVNWTNPVDLDFNHVEVWYNSTEVSLTHFGNSTGTSVNITGLANNTAYTIQVRTVDNLENKGGYSTVTANTTQNIVPEVPLDDPHSGGGGGAPVIVTDTTGQTGQNATTQLILPSINFDNLSQSFMYGLFFLSIAVVVGFIILKK